MEAREAILINVGERLTIKLQITPMVAEVVRARLS